MRRLSLRLLLATWGGMLACHDAQALLTTCTVSATTLNFGVYNPIAGTPNDATGTVTVSCTAALGVLVSWSVALGTGSSGSFSPRKLGNGPSFLNYNLYTTAAHSVVWGDGSGSTALNSGSQVLVLGSSTANYSVYGEIPIHQDRAAGAYTDSITVTVTY